MSYASDLRAAAEAEREATTVYGNSATLAGHTLMHKASDARIALTIPDRLLPFLAYVEQLERVAEAARAVRRFNEAPQRLALWDELAALDALDREAR